MTSTNEQPSLRNVMRENFSACRQRNTEMCFQRARYKVIHEKISTLEKNICSDIKSVHQQEFEKAFNRAEWIWKV